MDVGCVLSVHLLRRASAFFDARVATSPLFVVKGSQAHIAWFVLPVLVWLLLRSPGARCCCAQPADCGGCHIKLCANL
jgi:hypothetical protein